MQADSKVQSKLFCFGNQNFEICFLLNDFSYSKCKCYKADLILQHTNLQVKCLFSFEIIVLKACNM